jgi:hypothetical protein
MIHFCYHSFDLRQLVSFAEIARTGSFRQAAKTLHIAQPALREANPVLYDEPISCCHKASFTPNVIAEIINGPELFHRSHVASVSPLWCSFLAQVLERSRTVWEVLHSSACGHKFISQTISCWDWRSQNDAGSMTGSSCDIQFSVNL